jgi:hypothetical protein
MRPNERVIRDHVSRDFARRTGTNLNTDLQFVIYRPRPLIVLPVSGIWCRERAV